MKAIKVAYVRNRDYEGALLTGRAYSYRTELDLLEGDIIFVPTGRNNDMKRAIIKEVGPDQDFPFPVKVVGVEELLYTVNELSRNILKEIKEEEEAEDLAEDTGYFQI